MILPLLLLAATQSGPPAPPLEQRYDKCIALATSDPDAGAAEAGRWRLAGGGLLARQCLGIAYANKGNWAGAAGEFEAAARAAEVAKDFRAAAFWAQSGNAWLAAGDPTRARAALDAAVAAGTLTGQDRGEVYLDRARAQVAGKQLEGARVDLDLALTDAPADPLAWLLSATLARKMDDLPRAKKDIAEALKRSGDDASVQLEAGNIAALAGDADGAKAAWRQAASIAPDSPAGKNAQIALSQFDTVAKP